MAIASAKIRMNTSAIRKISMFSLSARRTFGNEYVNSSQLKNACLTSGQPLEVTTISAMAPKTTSVLAVAIAVLRPAPPAPRMRDERPGSFKRRTLLQDGRAARDPLLLELLQRPIGTELAQRLVQARDQRAAPGRHEAEVLLLAAGRWQAPD